MPCRYDAGLLAAILALSTLSVLAKTPNLVPTEPAKSANCWCTWYAQNYWQQRGGEITDFKAINNPNAREELTYHHLYHTHNGWATTYLPRGHQTAGLTRAGTLDPRQCHRSGRAPEGAVVEACRDRVLENRRRRHAALLQLQDQGSHLPGTAAGVHLRREWPAQPALG